MYKEKIGLGLGMKTWAGAACVFSIGLGLALIFILTCTLITQPQSNKHSPAYQFFNPQHESESESDHPTPPTLPKPHFKNLQGLNELYTLTINTSNAFLAWTQMKFLFPRSDALPETALGIKEALFVWKQLLLTIHDNHNNNNNASILSKMACPHFVTTTALSKNVTSLQIPCGLVEDSSVTLIGIPDSRKQTFQIELLGSQVHDLKKPPIVLSYEVVLPGQNLTKEPVMIQNAWTQESGWGKEEKCPNHGSADLLKVDGLVKCNTQIIRRNTEDGLIPNNPANTKLNNISKGSTHESTTFHFVEGNPFTATLWAGNEGFHMSVNGRHETSFVYRNRLEPWLVKRVNVRGGLSIVSILAKGLPVDEDVDLVSDAQQLKAKSLSNKSLILLIGVFSSGNNFERRMAIRRTWMQYDAVRSGDVAVRFFIGFHKNKEVNLKLWKEAEAYGDIQLMPFVDYYSLLTYKTIAICIMGTKIVSAKYIMKMDDDAFVRIDEVLSSLKGKASEGLLYGGISYESAPHREKDNKWFISEEEWPHSTYPPWAHGPGYVISQDIARFIVEGHEEKDLMLFKLEDVAVGIWIEQYKRNSGRKIEYLNDDRFYNAGCDSDYILAHYQNPRMVLCLWEKIQKEHKAECCE